MDAVNRFIEALRHAFYIWVVRDPHQSIQTVAEKFNQSEEVTRHSQDVAGGFEEWEKDFWERFMQQKGSILDIGCGAGREAITFTRLGFAVTGIDIAANMIEAAIRNAESAGVKIEFKVQSATEINYPPQSFDYVIFSRTIYSFIPTRALRINVLRAVRNILKPTGLAVFSAYYYARIKWFSRAYLVDIIRKCLRFLLGDRFKTEPGDILLGRVSEASDQRKLCFAHPFSSPREILEEIQAAGLKAIEGEKTGFWVIRP
jgi:2-polyprenyl-3-methyl-5-hydroxy-6-metoxy-1,4-benzoquinol methylase